MTSVDHLEEQGWEEIGYGTYGSVWSKDGRIIKLCRDRAYHDWIRFATRNTCPHFPVVHHTTRTPDDCFAVQLEPLLPLTKRETWSLVIPVFARQYKRNLSAALIERIDQDFGYSRALRLAAGLPDSFLQALDACIANRSRWTVDLPWHNVMKRSDGTMVITDPWIKPRATPLSIYDYARKEYPKLFRPNT